MAKFGKSKFRNGQRVSNDAKWTDVDMRSSSAKYRKGRSGGSGILGKAIAKAVRQSVRESLSTPTYKTSAPTYTTKVKAPKVAEDRHKRTTLEIWEMPPELRYLSYPHLKPKPQAKPKPKVVVKPLESPATDIPRNPYDGSYRELWDIIKQFFVDLWRG